MLHILKIESILLVRISELENLVNCLLLVSLSALDAVVDYSCCTCWTEDILCCTVTWQLLLEFMMSCVIRSLVWIECSFFFINVNSFLVSHCADLLKLFCISRRLTILQSMFICCSVTLHFFIWLISLLTSSSFFSQLMSDEFIAIISDSKASNVFDIVM